MPCLHSFAFTGKTRKQIVAEWAELVRDAWARYEMADNAFQSALGQAITIMSVIGPTRAIQKARNAEGAALAEYVRLLRIFTELVVQGKVPGDIEPR